MIIANQKKQESIVEYIIYMWQIEDLIRANSLSMEKLEQNVIAAYQVDENTRKQIRQWYSDLIEMMQLEARHKTGHLQIITNIVTDLDGLHRNILAAPTEIAYHKQYVAVAPDIELLRTKTPDSQLINEIQLALNALYGFIILKMSRKEISMDTQKSISEISRLMVLLANKYHERELREKTDENI